MKIFLSVTIIGLVITLSGSWIIDDAAHVDFYNFSQEKYEHVVLDFLGKHLASQITEDNHSRLRKNSKVISST